MAALKAAFVYQRPMINLKDRLPFVEILPPPDPGQRIFIVRTLVRLHNHSGPLRHPDSLLTVLFRASDGAPLGGAVLDSVPGTEVAGGSSGNSAAETAWDEHEFNFSPHGFMLEIGDTLGVVTSHEPREGIIGHTCAVNILVAWHRIEAKFLNVALVPGNPPKLIGVKDDGTLWRADNANASPLVWTQT